MKKNFKRTLAKVMAVALTVALAGTAAPEADAAKKIKLSKKSITVTKGKTKKVTIKNVKAKKVKKLTVKSNKKKIATVKKAGKTAFKVTGKKKGNAKITATVKVKGKKKATKLTLKVAVKNPGTPTPTAAPTTAPTKAPTAAPSVKPSTNPSAGPSTNPSAGPSTNPSAGPSTNPSAGPSTAPTATPTPAPVESEATEIKNINLAGEMKEFVRSFEVKDGSATVELSNNAKYDHAYMYFDYTIPEGATLDDILAVRFDYKATGKDCTYKNLCVLAGQPDTFPMKGLGWDYTNKKPGDGAANVSKEDINTSSATSTDLTDQEIQVVAKDLKKIVLEGNTVRFCLYVHINGLVDGEYTKYTFSNIKVMSNKGKAGTDALAAPGAKIDNTAKAEAVAIATNDTPQIDAGDTSKEITLTVPKADIEGYGVTITKQEVKATQVDNVDVLTVTDNKDNTYTVKLKSGFTLPEGTPYVTVPVKGSLELNTGGVIETTLEIVVGDNSVVDIPSELGKKEGEYVLLDLSKAFIRDGNDAEITLTPGTKGGVDVLNYDISATSNGNLWVGWDFSTVDMTNATEVIILVKSEGAGAKLASVGADDKSWLSDISYFDPKADVFTKVTIPADKFVQYMGIKGNSWNGALDIYAVAVVGGKEKAE